MPIHPDVSLAITADGSSTFYNAEIGEHYHSRHGALQESRHVFLKSGLQFFLSQNPAKELSVLEVGFGTGLNFLLSAGFCVAENIKLNYTGIEAFPLALHHLKTTNYKQLVDNKLWDDFNEVYETALKKQAVLNAHVNLEIVVSKLDDFTWSEKADVIYFDAFAAIHQPEMWTDKALAQVCQYLKPGGVFVTYAITGNLKRSMKALGFSLEKAPGAPGKREMLRAVKSA